MAYAQQNRYGVPQRPSYEHQQASYPTSTQRYAPEYGSTDWSHSDYYNDPPQGGPPQQYNDPYGTPGGMNGQGQGTGQEGDAQYGNSGQYGPRGQQRGGRQEMQQPGFRALKPGRHGYNDSRSQGQQPKSRFPPRNLDQQQYHGYEWDQHGEGQGPQQDYHQKQALIRPNEVLDEYVDPSYAPRSDWASTQHYGHVCTDAGNSYYEPNRDAGYRVREIASGNGRGPSPDPRGYIGNTSNPVHEAPAPRSPKGQSKGSSTRSERSQCSKPAFKRIIEDPISPDTIAWDNPFPTFPTKPKKGAHTTSRSIDNSSGGTSLKDGLSQDKSYDSRPQTASSKSSNYINPQTLDVEDPPENLDNQRSVFAGQKSRWPKGHGQNHAAAQARPSHQDGGRTDERVDQLKPPVAGGRHSEENGTRPTVRNDATVASGYERSRTMPTAVSEAAVQASYQPGQRGQPNWQGPGPTGGYYGPHNTEQLPVSPVDVFPHGVYIPETTHSNEGSRYGDGSARTQKKSYQKHAQQASLGDFFDDYYDTSEQDHHSSRQNQTNRYRSPIDEEMPNFNAVPDPGAIHRRGRTIDQHLQSQPEPHEYPPMPPPPPETGRREETRDPKYTGHFPPRSRSQPNLKDQRSPRAGTDDSFNFGVPGPRRPPVTGLEAGGYVIGANATIGYANVGPQQRNGPPIRQGPQEPPRAPGHGAEVRNGPKHPPPQSDLPPIPYQNEAPMARYRSPPVQDGRPRQGQTRPPGAGHAPTLARGPAPKGYSNVDRPHGGQRPPGGVPSPVIRPRPSSPPTQLHANPDALPSHPAPVRPGLIESSPVNQAAKPPPVRQYNAAPSPMQQSNPTRDLGSSDPTDNKNESAPVTHQELERLRQTVARRPDDQAIQLSLAKKLVEAAYVLVDERSDAKTRSKSREKYISDAYRIVKKLSGNGFTEATFYLADAYSRGALGLDSDTREAFKLYQTAAKSGHAQAAYRVAVCCEIGQEEGGGTSRDAVKAMQWYKRAAVLGDTPAMYKMGIISLKGLLGQPRNHREALDWLKKAAKQADRENPHALHELGLLYEKSGVIDGVTKDEAYSMQHFTQAAKLGYKFSQFRLGCAYEYGLLGCTVDPRQSIAWYSKAAVQEEHQSELALSGWYLTGSEGVLQQSDTEAYLWARKAALAGLAKAEYAMGYFTEVGIGAPANLDDAKRWYWRAASQNFQKARDRLEDLRKGGGTKQKMRVSRSNMKKQSDGECVVM